MSAFLGRDIYDKCLTTVARHNGCVNVKDEKSGSGKKPIEVKVGSVVLKIYEQDAPNARSGKSYCLTYYEGNRRVRRTFTDLDKAKQEAYLVGAKLATGEGDVLTLSSADRQSYCRANALLEPLRIPLHCAVEEFVSARKTLNGTSLLEVVEWYRKSRKEAIVPKSVLEVHQEHLAACTEDQLSERHIRTLRSDCGRFAKAFSVNIADIQTSEIDDWLRSLKVGGRTRNNKRESLLAMFNFARRRGYLPRRQPTEVEDVPMAKEEPSETHILTPDEMGKLLSNASDEALILYLAICGFAGLRHSEFLRLDFSDIHMANGHSHIEVKPKKAKTSQRRIIPVQDNLGLWLKTRLKEEGMVATSKKIQIRARKFAAKLGIEWRSNMLRHSYGSYRLAQCKSAAQVALEMGNTPQMVFRHYYRPIAPAEMKEWWSIKPKKVAKNRKGRRNIEV